MPSFNTTEMNVLRYTDRYNPLPNFIFTEYIYDLVEKCCLMLNDDGHYEITKYGEEVLGFYDGIKRGKFKSKCDGCNGC